MEIGSQSNLGTNIQMDHSSINPKELLLKYLHYGWLFVLLMVLSVTFAWIYLRYTKPVYSVSSTLLIRNDNAGRSGGMTGSQDMFSDLALFQSNTNKQNEILILSSRTVMERVVKSLGLQYTYEVVGTVKTTNIFSEQPFELEILNAENAADQFSLEFHFSNDWSSFTVNENKQRVQVGEEFTVLNGKYRVRLKESFYRNFPFRSFIVKYTSLQNAAINYQGYLKVAPANDQSNVLMLTFVNENPQLSTAILNELVYQYNDATIQDKNEINRKILLFINDRLKLVESQLDSVEGSLQKYRTTRQVIDLSAQSGMYFEDVAKINENLRQQEIQLQVAKLLEQYLNQPSNRLSLVPSTLGLTDPTLLQLTAAYNELVAERMKQIQTGATLNNPFVKNLEKSIEEARVKMLQNLINIQQVYKNNINALNLQNKGLRKEITSVPEREKETRERARQQEIKQNLYLYLMQKREESEIAQASTIANSRVIDAALPIYQKVNPVPLKIYGIAILLGILLPVLIIYIIDALNDKVVTKSDIVKYTDTPIIGEIGHSEEDHVLLFPEHSRTIVAEQIRLLRSNLRFVLGEKYNTPTVLVTSSFSGEGKSFISTNLGAALAISGKKTVILEFDLRKPKILAGLGLSRGVGLTNFLVGSAAMEELPQPVQQIENLYVIPCGPVPPNPSEILLTSKVGDLFAWLKDNFDAIVIDTAPVGLVSDSFTLSKYANASIYVIRQRYTYKRQISFVNDLYKQKKLPVMGILVNDVIDEGIKSYYGYGSGRYGYGYGYGYASRRGNELYPKRKKGLLGRIRKAFSRV